MFVKIIVGDTGFSFILEHIDLIFYFHVGQDWHSSLFVLGHVCQTYSSETSLSTFQMKPGVTHRSLPALTARAVSVVDTVCNQQGAVSWVFQKLQTHDWLVGSCAFSDLFSWRWDVLCKETSRVLYYILGLGADI